MTTIRTHRKRRALTGATVLAAALTASAVQAPSADVLDPATVIAAAKTAYAAYEFLEAGKLDLPQATAQILGAIRTAKTEIIAHMDRLAVTDARTCALSAVSGLENMAKFNDTLAQQFARETDACVNRIHSLLGTVTDKAAADDLGYSLHGVGPVALIAHANVKFSTNTLQSTLKSANSKIIAKLVPSCTATPLLGDAWPGGTVEVMLRCRAYNGDIGTDTAFTTNPKGATYNFTLASNQATRNISRAVSQAVAPLL